MAITDNIIFQITTSTSTGTLYRKNTYNDWHLMPMTKLLVVPPPFKANYVQYESNSGALDMSTQNGFDYGMRVGKWQFKLMPGYDVVTIAQSMMDFLHGGYFEIILSNDSGGSYFGRVTIDDFKSSDRGEYITLGYIIEPFRIDNSTVIERTIRLTSSELTQTVNVPLTRMKVTPYIKVSSLSGTLTINWQKPNMTTMNPVSTNITINTADSTYSPLQASSIVIQKCPGGVGYSPTATTTPIKFTVTTGGSATISFRYVGGWL